MPPNRRSTRKTRLVRTARISAKGQIVLPADIRALHGLREGDEVVVVTDGERILIETEARAAEKFADEFDYLEAAAERSLAELWDNEADSIWDQYA